MSARIAHLLAELQAAGFELEMAERLQVKYFEDWRISDSPEEREKIFTKSAMVEELLAEFLSIIDSIPQGER